MNIDLHPIIVHTPIAFLTVYAILEVLTVSKRLRQSQTFFTLKYFLLCIGFLGTLAATVSGEQALALNKEFVHRQIAHLHEEYAEMTRNIFGLIFLIYISVGATLYPQCLSLFEKISTKLKKYILQVGDFFKRYYGITIVLALVGLGLVSITGALGGALVYGTESKDPFIGAAVDLVCGAECR